MAYESVRRQLDKLLGPDRDVLRTADRQSEEALRFDHQSVCKDYLLGLCLSTLAFKRRGMADSCNKLHSDDLVEKFREADRSQQVPMKRAWQQQLAASCRALVLDEDRRIQGIASRLKETYGFSEPARAIVVPDLATLQSLGILVNGVDAAKQDDELADESGSDASNPGDGDGDGDGGRATTPGTAVPRTDASLASEEDLEIKILDSSSTTPSSRITETSAVHAADKRADPEATDPPSKSESTQLGPSPPSGSTEEKQTSLSKTSQAGVPEANGSIVSAVGASQDKDGETQAESQKDANKAELPVDEDPPLKPGNKPSSEAKKPNNTERSGTESPPGLATEGVGPGGLLLKREYKLRVCGLCGGLFSLHDAESRLATHYAGKSHASAVRVRSKLSELEQDLENSVTRQGTDRRDYRRPAMPFHHDRPDSGARDFDRSRERPWDNRSHADRGSRRSPRASYRSDRGPEDYYGGGSRYSQANHGGPPNYRSSTELSRGRHPDDRSPMYDREHRDRGTRGGHRARWLEHGQGRSHREGEAPHGLDARPRKRQWSPDSGARASYRSSRPRYN